MWVEELWRYPVKSMAGEKLTAARLTAGGVHGDRILHVEDRSGRVVTARTRPRLLGHRAMLGPDGEPLVDGRPWDDPALAADVERAAGSGARLVRSEGGLFDVLPLLVATDGAIAAFGHDGRRLRPNIVIGGVKGLAERGWEGLTLRAGGVLIAIRDLRQRCVMTTFDPDTLAQDIDVLRRIHHEFDGALALNCSVLREGTIAVGDSVELVEPAAA